MIEILLGVVGMLMALGGGAIAAIGTGGYATDRMQGQHTYSGVKLALLVSPWFWSWHVQFLCLTGRISM